MNFPKASSSQHRQRKKKSNSKKGRDRISSLPDELLVHILSFLPTVFAFRTSILSTRWEYLWTLVPVLNFSPYENTNFSVRRDPGPGYMNFIEMILLQHSTNVKRFVIEYPGEYDASRLYAWISTLLKHNVQDIEIVGDGLNIQLPRNLFTCKTLVTLKIQCRRLYVQSSVHFPCVKVLSIFVEIPDHDMAERLFCSAPVLEELEIFVVFNNGGKVYNISSTCLKKLRMFVSARYVGDFDIEVIVDAPALETFDVEDSCFARYILKNSSSLFKARIDVDVDTYDFDEETLGNKFVKENLIMLLKSVSNVKDLSLASSYPLAAFGSSYESKWPVFANTDRLDLDFFDDYDSSSFSRWPLFPKLKHLLLRVCKDFASKNLSDLLELAPNLISLKLVKVTYRDKPGQFNSSEQRIPSCFRSCLREIEIREIDGSKSELNVIKYLLENAQMLEKMKIKVAKSLRSVDQRKAEELEYAILMITPSSKHVEFVFT